MVLAQWCMVSVWILCEVLFDPPKIALYKQHYCYSYRLVTLTERESRLQEVRSTFLSTYNSTVGLKLVSPSSSGAIGGLLEQFVRGVGLRGSSVL